MNGLTASLEEQLCTRERRGNVRDLHDPLEGLVDFASNDYLGLNDQAVLDCLVYKEKSQMIEYCRQWHGAGGSRLLTGNTAYCVKLEEEISRFHEEEAGLIFNSGYAANFGLLSAVAKSSDTILYDRAIHASLHDAIRFTRAKAVPFRHLDLNQFEERLKRAKGTVFVCADSVCSADGSQTDLKEMLSLCKEAGGAFDRG